MNDARDTVDKVYSRIQGVAFLIIPAYDILIYSGGCRVVDNIFARGAGGPEFAPRIFRKVDKSFTC